MKIFKKFTGIRGKVLLCFFFIIMLFCLYGLISGYLLTKNKNATERINDINQPSISALTELELMLTQSKNLVANWVKIEIENNPDKIKLKQLHEKEYPALKANLSKLQAQWEDKAIADSLRLLFISIDKNFAMQKEVMQNLAKFESYSDVVMKMEAESKSDQAASDINIINGKLRNILSKIRATTSSQQIGMIENMSLLTRTNFILLAVVIVLGLFFTLRLSNQIIKPVYSLHELVNKVSNGELDDLSVKPTKDEIGEMMFAVQKMIEGLKTTAFFANEIGKGNLESDYAPLSEKDVLGNALITMRDNLMKVAKEDKQRNWANEGYAQFGEILRSHYEDMNEMLDLFLSKLVKYVHANQGWLYIINDETDEEHFLELKSVYAFDRKKYVNKKILKGEGLAGQAWIEGDLIYITDVPQNYVNITSGLGDANPSSILIVPLKVNDTINGVIEFASFHEFHPYQIEFVQKLSESLASTLSTMKINVRTKVLLEESQKQRNQMHEQEEELRQNLEELQATQEEMERKQENTELLIEQLRERDEMLTKENEELIHQVKLLKTNKE